MRPVELVVAGFGPFRDEVTIDFRDAELFAIVGPTGHGKSSIIDALCFALYGRVPRHGDKEIAPVITLGAAEARVALTFTLGPRTYLASRIVRRKPDGVGATTRGVRLEAVHDDDSTEVLAGSVKEFEPGVRKLLGLDFDQFTKCVALPQGRFAAFLHATSGERAEILGALLDLGRYDRMGRAARDRATHVQGLREGLERERARLGELDADGLEDQRRCVAALAALLAEIDETREADARLGEEIAELQREADASGAAMAVLGATRVADDVAARAGELAAAQQARDEVLATADATSARVAEAAAALDELPSLEELVPARDAHVDRETLLARIETGTGEHARLTAAAAGARDALVAAQQAVTQAETAVDEANRQHAHAELRATLAVGDACPVCEQVVTALPPRVSTAAATKARKALDAARRKARQADEQARTVLTQLERATAQLDVLRERVAALDVIIAAHPDRAALDATIATVRARAEAGKAARAELERTKNALAAATERVRAAEQRLERDEQAFQRQRDALVAAGLEPPPSGEGDLLVRWRALAAFAADRLPEIEKQAALAGERRAALVAERATTVGALTARAQTLHAVDRELTLAELASAVTGAQRDAQHAVEQREQQLRRATELDAEIAAARANEHVARELGRLLDRKHFRQWIVDEALRGLVAGASTVLREISSGQYSLAVAGDGDLVVVDHVNADETRSVHSLSGGETFQASLALALALADRIGELAADTAAPLESIFLDEGFGALDPESLDIVASTIESLARADRIVGVVTHVRALAERMPVRFRVQKVSGASSVVREDT